MNRCIICLEDSEIKPTINSCGCKVTLHSNCRNTMQSYGILCPICRIKKDIKHDNFQHESIYSVEYLFTHYPNALTFLLFIIFCFAFTILYIIPKLTIDYCINKVKKYYEVFSISN
jgi:hypothetical protein